MTASSGTGSRPRGLILAAMIFAVAMTFIDQTIVSIAVPEIQKELGLTSTGVQWAVNAYLLTLAAFFAFGGRLADTVGHRKMVMLGVIVFAGASALCGLTPKGSLAEAWIVTVPGHPGRRRRHHVPGRAGHRGADVPAARARQGAGAVLRHRRRPDRDRPGPGRLPHPVDLAGDLLGEHPGRAHRAGADPHLPADHRAPARPDGLPGPGPDRGRRGAERVRLPAVERLGLAATRPSRSASSPGWRCWSCSTSSSGAPNRR